MEEEKKEYSDEYLKNKVEVEEKDVVRPTPVLKGKDAERFRKETGLEESEDDHVYNNTGNAFYFLIILIVIIIAAGIIYFWPIIINSPVSDPCVVDFNSIPIDGV